MILTTELLSSSIEQLSPSLRPIYYCFFFSSFFLLLRLTDLLSYSKEVLFNPFHETGTVSLKSFGAFVVVVVVNLFLNHKDLLSEEVEDVKGLSAGGGSNTDERRYKNPFPQRRPPVTVDPSRPPYLLPPPTTGYTCLGKLYKSHTCRERRLSPPEKDG